MKFDFYSVFLFVFIVFSFTCPQSQASNSAQLAADTIDQVDISTRLLNMDDEIHQEPLRAYQQILTL